MKQDFYLRLHISENLDLWIEHNEWYTFTMYIHNPHCNWKTFYEFVITNHLVFKEVEETETSRINIVFERDDEKVFDYRKEQWDKLINLLKDKHSHLVKNYEKCFTYKKEKK